MLHESHKNITKQQYNNSVIIILILLVSSIPVWFSIYDHPLYPPDEGRYASVSRNMIARNDWIIPVSMGEPHITKPPLTYWLESTGLLFLNDPELAVRLPSVIAGIVSLFVVFALGRSIGEGSLRVGLISAGLYGLMPLPIVVNRLAVTDPILGLFWLLALWWGYQAVITRRYTFALGAWVAVGLGLLAKGPLGISPMVILAVWLLFAGEWRKLRYLRIGTGIIIAMLPVSIWVFLVHQKLPDAFDIWYHEIVDRATGNGAHSEPLWYYVPVFIGGLFPATAMLMLPGINFSWRAGWAILRKGTTSALLTWAVILPFILFTLITGKLPTYLLPLTGPMAILTALMLERWLNRTDNHEVLPDNIRRLPDVVTTLSIVCLLMAAGAIIAAFVMDKSKVWMALPFLILPAGSIFARYVWKHQPNRRIISLMILWVCGIGIWCWSLEMEDIITDGVSEAKLVSKVKDITGYAQPEFLTLGFRDLTLGFYAGIDSRLINSEDLFTIYSKINDDDDDDNEKLSAHESAVSESQLPVIVVRVSTWERIIQDYPTLVTMYQPLCHDSDNCIWKAWFDKELMLLQPVR